MEDQGLSRRRWGTSVLKAGTPPHLSWASKSLRISLAKEIGFF